MPKNIDDMLKSTKKADIPTSTFEKVDNVLKNLEQRKVERVMKRKFFKSIAAIAACVLIMSGGIVYASITGIWQNIFNINDIGNNMTVQEHIQNVDMKYATSSGVGIKANSIILDDSRFEVVYEIKLPEELPECDWINFANLTVLDENGNVLYGEVDGTLSTNESIAVEKIDDTTFQTSIKAENVNGTYPKNKKLHFTLSQIHCLNSVDRVGNGFRQVAIYDGNWQFEIDMENIE